MLQLVRNNNPYTAVLLFVFGLALHAQAIAHAGMPEAVPSQLLFGFVLSGFKAVLGSYVSIYALIGYLFLYFQGIMLSALAARHRLFMRHHYLPAFAYIAVSSLFPQTSLFTAASFINFLWLFILHELLLVRQEHRPGKMLFNIGLALSGAAFMQSAAILFAPAVFLSVLILRPFNLREWFVLLIGMFIGLYFLWVFLYCTDNLFMLEMWARQGLSLPGKIKLSTYYQIILGGLAVWLCLSFYNMQSQLPKAQIFVRRSWLSISFCGLFACAAAVFSGSVGLGNRAIIIPFASLILSQAFVHERNKKTNVVAFWFVLALLAYGQVFLPMP